MYPINTTSTGDYFNALLPGLDIVAGAFAGSVTTIIKTTGCPEVIAQGVTIRDPHLPARVIIIPELLSAVRENLREDSKVGGSMRELDYWTQACDRSVERAR
ncbi:hypothetical protein V1507DRAFT_437180 [Lipomyces tetrasporus]